MGLEIDQRITKKAVSEIEKNLKELKKSKIDSIVWFCINQRCNRLEKYESNMIYKLSQTYEIPFIIVFTQCYSKEGKLKRQIEEVIPDIHVYEVLAKDLELDEEYCVKAFGVDELLGSSIVNYNEFKTRVLKDKLSNLDKDKKERIRELEELANKIILECSENAGRICEKVFAVKPMEISRIKREMLERISEVYGINKRLIKNLDTQIIYGLINKPLMLIPGVMGASAAESYIEGIGYDFSYKMKSILEDMTDEVFDDERARIEELIKRLESR